MYGRPCTRRARRCIERDTRSEPEPMADVVDPRSAQAPAADKAADAADLVRERRPVPNWLITTGSLIALLLAWEYFGRDINPVFGSYPSAIIEAGIELVRSGKLWSALLD